MPEAKVCPPQILALVDHLRSTGTGKHKLTKLTELGKITKSLDEFLEMAPANVSTATMQKIDEYLGKQFVETEQKKSGKKLEDDWKNTKRGKLMAEKAKDAVKRGNAAAEGSSIEYKDENQSSIPEHTVIMESRAPVLQKEGSSQAKQLGSAVEVDKGGSTEADSDDEASEVADMNAADAKDAISRMRSKDKLNQIVDTDPRVTVKEAAQKRLDELESGG